MRDDGGYGPRVFDMTVAAAPGGYVHVDVPGLTAGRRYRYAFFETMDGAPVARSAIGRFRAAIAADTEETVLIGACSCTYNPFRPQTLEHAGTREDLDLFLLLGDTSYNDGSDSVDEYRDKWEESLGREGYLAVRAATSVLATWDDHEVDNNWNPETFDMAQAARARQTFFESLPLRRDATTPDRIWKRIRWGRTVEVFVLDCRGERVPSTRMGPMATYMSRAQLDWLKAGLMESSAVFKVIANSVPIGDFPALFGAGDRWEGYPAQRTEILDFIDDMGIEGVLWVSGDFHLGSIGNVGGMGAPGANQLEVLAGPGAQLPNPLSFALGAPMWDFATEQNNYVTLGLDPATRELTVTFHRPDGGVLTTRSYTL
jgi:alkaline phosphatase D